MRVIKMENLAVGIMAHVDAGKTTLTEAILYKRGVLRKLGRVDHKDAFLDHYDLERKRGITIFSKQAVLDLDGRRITLVDTPGHTDFSGETERTLQILDYAILVISGPEGVQGHTKTLWKMLEAYHIPVIIFVNKMDREDLDRDHIMTVLKGELSDGCIDFSAYVVEEEEVEADAGTDSKKDSEIDFRNDSGADFMEELAMTDEKVFDYYMEHNEVTESEICRLIRERKAYPVYFGSALKLRGIDHFLTGISKLMEVPRHSEDFGARVYKISRDDRGERLTFLKITGGSLKVRSLPDGRNKINQIRIYSGAGYETVLEAEAGTVCAVTGLEGSYAGQGLGFEEDWNRSMLQPVLHYQLLLPEGTDAAKIMKDLQSLEEEEPLLHVAWNSSSAQIHVQLMGDVQIEVLKSLIKDRFGLDVEFGPGSIVYKETLLASVIGVGHYEPLRHYAEVHVRMDPLPVGSGMEYASECSEDVLDRNWQRLILTHFQEKEHLGVLTGSPLTDLRLTLTTGRAHLKHTEGGDFRQATYRAIRQGLMKGRSGLLEPWYDFRLEIPASETGRGMADIQKRYGTFSGPELDESGERAVLTGKAPAATMNGYQVEVLSYTKGTGRLTLTFRGYEACHNEEEVIERIGYDCQADADNPSSSVFCSHGAGFLVPWDQVEDYMHLKDGKGEDDFPDQDGDMQGDLLGGASSPGSHRSGSADRSGTKGAGARSGLSPENDPAFRAIYEREFGKGREKEDRYSGYRSKTKKPKADLSDEKGKAKGMKSYGASPKKGSLPGSKSGNDSAASGQSSDSGRRKKPAFEKKDYLLVDGYNVIFAWEELKGMAEDNLDGARAKLAEILSNYQGFTGCTVILVFDAYKVKGGKGEVYKYHNIYIVYTKEAETADQYIEKTTHEIGRKHNVTVATSDGVEQVIVMGQGAARMSSRDLHEEIERVETEIRRISEEKKLHHHYLFDQMDEDLAAWMEEVRLGRSFFD